MADGLYIVNDDPLDESSLGAIPLASFLVGQREAGLGVLVFQKAALVATFVAFVMMGVNSIVRGDFTRSPAHKAIKRRTDELPLECREFFARLCERLEIS